jgi:hypothetical protein
MRKIQFHRYQVKRQLPKLAVVKKVYSQTVTGISLYGGFDDLAGRQR